MFYYADLRGRCGFDGEGAGCARAVLKKKSPVTLREQEVNVRERKMMEINFLKYTFSLEPPWFKIKFYKGLRYSENNKKARKQYLKLKMKF